jgi:peroxiredoxin
MDGEPLRDPTVLPEALPVPEDDGACDHLEGAEVPAISLPAHRGGDVNLAGLAATRTVLFIYPRTGKPGEPLPPGWDLIPGARGCTPQSCAFRDLGAEFAAQGVAIAGLSAQSSDDQFEFATREHIGFRLLSDESLQLKEALRLPTFEAQIEGAPKELYKRVTLVLGGGRIEKAFYPVFPPDRNAAEVLAWL